MQDLQHVITTCNDDEKHVFVLPNFSPILLLLLNFLLSACSAIQAYTTAVAHQPTHWDAQCNLADALHARGQLDTAISLYRAIIQHCPTEASVFSSLGNALHANGEFNEAVDVYQVINLTLHAVFWPITQYTADSSDS